MGIFERQKTPEKMEQDLDLLQIQDEVATKQMDIAEKEAVIKQLKKQYGTDWKAVLGVNKLTDLASLKSFLKGAYQGMQAQGGGSGTNRSMLHPGHMPPQLMQAQRGKMKIDFSREIRA